MAVGKSVIKQVLLERLGDAQETRPSKIPLLISGIVLCQAMGIVLVQAALRTTDMDGRLGWGFLSGFTISACLLVVGHRYSSQRAALSPWKTLLKDYYSGLAELLGARSATPTIRDTEAEMLSVLWNSGVVSHRDLEGKLAKLGSPVQQIKQALENLRGHDLVLVRADGVSIGPESKRLWA